MTRMCRGCMIFFGCGYENEHGDRYGIHEQTRTGIENV